MTTTVDAVRHESGLITKDDVLDKRVRKNATTMVRMRCRFNGIGARYFDVPSAGRVEAPTLGGVGGGKIDATRYVEFDCYPHEVAMVEALIERSLDGYERARRAYETQLRNEIVATVNGVKPADVHFDRDRWPDDWKRVEGRTSHSVEAEFNRSEGRGVLMLAEAAVVEQGLPLPKADQQIVTEAAVKGLAEKFGGSQLSADALAAAMVRVLREVGPQTNAGPDVDALRAENERLSKEIAALKARK